MAIAYKVLHLQSPSDPPSIISGHFYSIQHASAIRKYLFPWNTSWCLTLLQIYFSHFSAYIAFFLQHYHQASHVTGSVIKNLNANAGDWL